MTWGTCSLICNSQSCTYNKLNGMNLANNTTITLIDIHVSYYFEVCTKVSFQSYTDDEACIK